MVERVRLERIQSEFESLGGYVSCLHIQGKRREVSGCPPFKFSSPNGDHRALQVEYNAQSKNPLIRASAAASPFCSQETLGILVYDESSAVREWVARNPEAGPAALALLAQDDENPRVRGYVAWNPSCPPELIKSLAENDPNDTVRMLAKTVLDNKKGRL